MDDLISRVQRELPDTDRTRYDVAYQRGRAQARSTLLAGGLALGSAVGAGLMWLLDPSRGAGRRAQLAQRLTGLKNGVARTAGGRTAHLQNRLGGFAIERGIKQPSDDGDHHAAHRATNGSNGSQYGQGYVEGFGQTHGDPDAPGARVPDPIEPEEALRYGASGPVAGAAVGYDESDVKPLTEAERAANR